MATNRTSKGQVTVPEAVRDNLGLKPGAPVTFERLPSGEVVLRRARGSAKARPSRFAKLRGRLTMRLSAEAILTSTRGA